MKLTDKDIQLHQKLGNDFFKIEKKFDDRVEEVVCLIHKCFGMESRNYWYSNAAEGEMGTLSPSELYDKNGWIYLVYGEAASKMNLGYNDCIPTAFLYMSDKEITAQVKSEIKQDKEDKEKVKAKIAQKKLEKNKVAKLAMKKLSSAEKKALGLKGK